MKEKKNTCSYVVQFYLQLLGYSRWLLGCFDWLLVGVRLDWMFWFTRFGVLGVTLSTVSKR